MVFEVEGMLAPVFTPMSEAGAVNLSVIPAYMEHLKKHRVNGILVSGTTGEGMSLNVEERKSLLEAWVFVARPAQTKVIAQVGGAALPDVLELAKHAEKLNVDGIMTLPELYYKPRTTDQLISYLQRVSAAAPTLPLVYYDFPMMSGVNVNMKELFTSASSKLPNFKGAKADLNVAEQVAHLLAQDQKIFIANHHIAPSVLMGHDSSIATVVSLFPELVHNIRQAVKDGEVVKAKLLQRRLNALVDAIASKGDFVPSMKTAMELTTGIRMGPTRSPLVPLNCVQRKDLINSLIELDVQLQMTD
ncbi:N-acetylneuraminate lyase-like [Spodoptera frugiperda]|uniref:N-acetylneuraminate lyase n=1 Tax=Spodoptera frugiperda TaxID=7108 RepID=A0A9R0EPU6_SPOFR|nr:N-acetylneuraminate lyase-like [Spodoptera frugiperda]